MARKKQVDPLAGEDALARRIAYERERRTWSPGGLANLMTKAGCPMNQSAIWKIENGNPRRKITVDEAVAFAKVFETSVEDLLLPPEAVTEAAAMRLYREWLRCLTDAQRALATCGYASASLTKYLAEQPETAKAVRHDFMNRGAAVAGEDLLADATLQAELMQELIDEGGS